MHAIENKDYDVIVVGAGAAGLAATKALVSAGKSVICLEAADRIGGRCHTDTEIFGVPFDVGAHWLHSESVNVLIGAGQSLGLDLYPQPEISFCHGDPDETLWDVVEKMRQDMARAAKGPHDVSLLDVFEPNHPWSYTAALMNCLSMGRDMAQISVKEGDLDHADPDWFCREGFGTLLAMNAGDVPVRLNTPVSAITHTASGVEVETPDGTATALAIVVTVSQGVLAAETIRFDPPFETDRLRAIDAITMGMYNHTALKFAPDTLPIEADSWATYALDGAPDGILRGGGFLCNASGTGLSVFETAGSFAAELEEAGADAAIDFALERLTDMFGSNIRKDFVKGHAMQWGQNPFTQGAYSGALPGGSDLRSHLGQPHGERIHFAGEATHLGESATVCGAHKEGLRAATDVLGQLT